MLVFGKVEEGLELGAGVEERGAPGFVAGRQGGAGGCAQREEALLLGGCGEAVAQGFDLREGEARVGEGAAGEFAGGGGTDGVRERERGGGAGIGRAKGRGISRGVKGVGRGSGAGGDGGQDSAHDGRAAVDV